MCLRMWGPLSVPLRCFFDGDFVSFGSNTMDLRLSVKGPRRGVDGTGVGVVVPVTRDRTKDFCPKGTHGKDDDNVPRFHVREVSDFRWTDGPL